MIILPQGLPALRQLQAEGILVASYAGEDALPASCGSGKITQVLFLNLMPEKEKAELDTSRILADDRRCVQLIPVKMAHLSYKNTPREHMDAFYKDFETLEHDTFDGLIINGAPLEHLPFEQVRYWPQLCRIMDWSLTHTRSVLHVCWGAQAALYHHYGIPKHPVPAKMFGVFQQQVDGTSPLMRKLSPAFPMPNSRHTEVRAADIWKHPELKIVAESDESGVGVVTDERKHLVFCFGHPEYGARTLEDEFLRDRAKGLPIAVPRHYYEDENPARPIRFRWQAAAKQFYANWLEQVAEPL